MKDYILKAYNGLKVLNSKSELSLKKPKQNKSKNSDGSSHLLQEIDQDKDSEKASNFEITYCSFRIPERCDLPEVDRNSTETDEFDCFKKCFSELTSPGNQELSFGGAQETEPSAGEYDEDVIGVVRHVKEMVKQTGEKLKLFGETTSEGLESAPLLNVHNVFHAILSQHILTADKNEACTNLAILWRQFSNKKSEFNCSLDSMRRACRMTFAIVAGYGWSEIYYSHLVCHLVCVELASMLSSRTTIC